METPGPLTYSVAYPGMKSSPVINIGVKRSIKTKETTKPAPNKYFPAPEKSHKAASFKGLYKETKFTLKTPGPANYVLPSNLFSGPHIGLGPRLPESSAESQHYKAGPTSYDPLPDSTRTGAPKYSLGKKNDSAFLERLNTPSPASYHLSDRQMKNNDAPKFSLKSRREANSSQKYEQTSPGPADYIELRPFVAPTVSQLARIQIIKNQESNNLIAHAEKKPFSKTPGPSDYNVKSLGGEGFSLGKRLDSRKNDSNPSPNAYNIRSERTKAAIRMKGRNSPFVLVFPSSRINTLRV